MSASLFTLNTVVQELLLEQALTYSKGGKDHFATCNRVRVVRRREWRQKVSWLASWKEEIERFSLKLKKGYAPETSVCHL